jgi:shikimate kinase
MSTAKNVFLIGPRACGKTSVGRALADRLGREFVDTDHALVEALGIEIADYVARNGWDAFRDREAEILKQVAGRNGLVVGCGGGIVLRPENCEILKTGVTLYLQVGVDTLAARLARDPNEAQRPSLTGQSVTDEVLAILKARASLYEGCADAIVFEGDLDTVVASAAAETLRLL